MPSRQDDAAIRQGNADTKRKRGGHKSQPLTKSQLKRVRNRRKRNKALYHEAVAMAGELGIELAESQPVADVLEKVFRRTHALWQHAALEVDRLDADAPPGTKDSIWFKRFDDNGNIVYEPSKWVVLENALRQELFEQAATAQKLNLDEARVRIEAAQLDILGQALKNAVATVGLDQETQRKVGAALRHELQVIEGTVVEHSTPELPTETAKAA